jgi:hypothetical protein
MVHQGSSECSPYTSAVHTSSKRGQGAALVVCVMVPVLESAHNSCYPAFLWLVSCSSLAPPSVSPAVVGAAFGACCHPPPLGLLQRPLRETSFRPAQHHSQVPAVTPLQCNLKLKATYTLHRSVTVLLAITQVSHVQ